MKKVFSNSDLAHVYSQQQQTEGRNSNNSYFFRDKTLYSYGHHFAICKFITNDSGDNILLFTERTYSNTTAKQISLARYGTLQHEKIYCGYPDGTHEQNFNYWKIKAENVATKLLKAKKPIKYLNELGIIQEKANKYANFFNIGIPEILSSLLSIKDKNEFLQYNKLQNEFIEREERLKKLKVKKAFKESFQKWLNLETSYLYNRINFDFLRLNSENVETTQGVKIPIEIAKRIAKKIENNTLNVGDKILNYTVSEVGNYIKIGCHTFNRNYLLKFSSKLF